MKSLQYNTILKSASVLRMSTRFAVDLAYKLYGKSNDKPVIIMHGLLGSKRNWDSMSKKIAGLNYRVITADMRNHGDSPHVHSHTYPELAADVSKLIDSLSLKQAVLIGHSMGGRTAMALALTEPDKVHKLVVVDISPVSTAGILNDFFPQLIKHMKAVNLKQQTDVTAARASAKQQLMNTGFFDNPEGIYFILMNIGKRSDTIGWMCNLDTLNKYFTEIATFPESLKTNKYSGPVLFIGGQNSNYIPSTDIDGIRSMFPKAELKYVANVGHNVHAEDPNTFFKLVKDFLSS